MAPSLISIFSSPLDVASSLATELPRPLRSASPLSCPKLVFIGSKVGNNCLSLKPRALSFARPCNGTVRPSRRICASSLPPATPKRSGSRRSTPSSSTKWLERSVNGRSSLCTMRLPLNVTSASMVRQRSVRNSSTGNTLPAGCLLAPPRAFCSALESAPISGARSLNSN
ncbi:hypothetical protein D3C77_503730 [compost metagenome]